MSIKCDHQNIETIKRTPHECFIPSNSWNTELSNLLKRDFGADWKKHIDQLIIGM